MKYFSIEELCKSDTASRLGIANTPNESERANMVALVENVLDPTREYYKRPIRVTSGFRCSKLNARVGGETHSQHTKGQAADIVCTKEGVQGNFLLGKIIAQITDFDQLIFEDVGPRDMLPKWIHVSYKSKEENRHQILKKVAGRKGYIAITKKDIYL